MIRFLEVNSKRPTPNICDVSRAWPQTVLVLYRMARLSQAFKFKKRSAMERTTLNYPDPRKAFQALYDNRQNLS
jgi:hypothetical protein